MELIERTSPMTRTTAHIIGSKFFGSLVSATTSFTALATAGYYQVFFKFAVKTI